MHVSLCASECMIECIIMPRQKYNIYTTRSANNDDQLDSGSMMDQYKQIWTVRNQDWEIPFMQQ